MQSNKRKTTIYLKSEDKDNLPQIQKELNILFKQKFNNYVVYHTATDMIRTRINKKPSATALLKLLEDKRDILDPQIPSNASTK